MTYSNRLVVLGIIASILLVHGTLYVLTMSAVHANGHTPHDFISGDGGDSFEYVALAETMLSDGRFAFSPTAVPETFRTPAYPLFIAGILAVTNNVIFLPIAQFILVALSAALIFLIGTRFYSRGIGLAAAILYAIDPSVYINASVSVTDTPFVFVLLLGIYVLCMPERLSNWRVFSGGVLMGILALTRPIGLYIFPIIILWLLWERRENWRQALKIAGIFFAGVFLIVAPWMARNYADFGHASVSSIGVYNFLFYNIIEFENQRTGVSKEILHSDILKQIGATATDDFRSLAFTSKVEEVASRYFLARPFEYAGFHLLSVVPFYIGSSIDAGTYSMYGRGALIGTLSPDINVSSLILHGKYGAALAALTANMPVLFERFIWLILCIGTLVTAVVATYRNKPNRGIIVLFFALIVAFGMLTGPVSYPRYRLPAEPFIFILGVAGVISIARYLRGVYSKCDISS